jgi:hypothetical protein
MRRDHQSSWPPYLLGGCGDMPIRTGVVIRAAGHRTCWVATRVFRASRSISGELATVPLGYCVRHGRRDHPSSWPSYLLGGCGNMPIRTGVVIRAAGHRTCWLATRVSVRHDQYPESWPPYLSVIAYVMAARFHGPSEQLATVPAGWLMQLGTITMSLAGATGGSSIICCRV